MGQNKRKQRTEALKARIGQSIVNEHIQNTVEQHKFDKLVKQGIIVKER